jgi:hypothetical protein
MPTAVHLNSILSSDTKVDGVTFKDATSQNAPMCFGTPPVQLGLRGAAAHRSATWPLALVGLGPPTYVRYVIRHCVVTSLLDSMMLGGQSVHKGDPDEKWTCGT